jgi:hypothetical protein
MTLRRAVTIRARKPHKCFLCYQPIEPGTMYHFHTMKGDDGLYSTHEHLSCAALASMMCGQGPYRDDFPSRDDMDCYESEDVWIMLGEAQDEHVKMALAKFDEAEQARGRCFVAAAALWGKGGIHPYKAWAVALEAEQRIGAECAAAPPASTTPSPD